MKVQPQQHISSSSSFVTVIDKMQLLAENKFKILLLEKKGGRTLIHIYAEFHSKQTMYWFSIEYKQARLQIGVDKY